MAKQAPKNHCKKLGFDLLTSENGKAITWKQKELGIQGQLFSNAPRGLFIICENQGFISTFILIFFFTPNGFLPAARPLGLLAVDPCCLDLFGDGSLGHTWS